MLTNQLKLEKVFQDLWLITSFLNEALQWIRYPLPHKKDLIGHLHNASIFSKFDLKSRLWIKIEEKDKYKITFTVPFGHYEWNVIPFGLKNAHLEFQNIINSIFNPCTSFSIVCIDDFFYIFKLYWSTLQAFTKLPKNC